MNEFQFRYLDVHAVAWSLADLARPDTDTARSSPVTQRVYLVGRSDQRPCGWRAHKPRVFTKSATGDGPARSLALYLCDLKQTQLRRNVKVCWN
ncbi:hypothetical protein [Mycobacterium sp. 1164966.3]|uniref:hypothetical protein n=1 Tax=Mycobacterium sp. 1164966.3 TaxID=1856861 RepID=UPI00082B803B|nr:hypothetical protein [Mycobacterium sp. 1164966.3]